MVVSDESQILNLSNHELTLISVEFEIWIARVILKYLCYSQSFTQVIHNTEGTSNLCSSHICNGISKAKVIFCSVLA